MIAETQNGHCVDTEHERLQVWGDARGITSRFDDTCLQARCVRDFEQRVNIFKIDLPESEDMDWLRVQSRRVDSRLP